jgi:hypothetical protein
MKLSHTIYKYAEASFCRIYRVNRMQNMVKLFTYDILFDVRCGIDMLLRNTCGTTSMYGGSSNYEVYGRFSRVKSSVEIFRHHRESVVEQMQC